MGDEGIARVGTYFSKTENNIVDDYLTINSIFTPDEKRQVIGDILFPSFNIKNDIADNINQMLYIDQNTFLQHLLVKLDKMSMAHGLECRVPFLDNRVVDFAQNLPTNLKIHRNVEKYIIRKAFAPYLPNILTKRKKQRFFVPIHHWYKEYRDEYDNVLSKENCKLSGMNHDYISLINKKYDNSPLYYGRQLWSMVIYQHWYNSYFSEELSYK
jgi:asparagine synthase (glutamine-hydrolysing)